MTESNQDSAPKSGERSWVDAPGGDGIRTYGSPDWRMHVTDEAVAIVPHPRPTMIFFAVFTPLFCAVLAALAVHLEKYFILVGLVPFLLAAGAMYWIVRHDASRGPKLLFDRKTRRFRLPRYNAEFPAEQVVTWQAITGRNRDNPSDPDVRTDLNLLVRDPSGRVVRYHVLGAAVAGVGRIAEFDRYAPRCRSL